MKKRLYILLVSCSICIFHVSSQNIFQQIKASYQMLDSITYIDKAYLKECNEWGTRNKEQINSCYQWYKDYLVNANVVFTLNIDVDSTLVHTGNYIKLDTCEYKFTLIFFDKKWKIKRNIAFVNNRIYPFFNEFTSSIYGKKRATGYKKIMKMNPQYILRCFRLPATIMYILNAYDEKIYVYQIFEEKFYELDEYMNKIKNTDKSDTFYYHYYLDGVIEW